MAFWNLFKRKRIEDEDNFYPEDADESWAPEEEEKSSRRRQALESATGSEKLEAESGRSAEESEGGTGKRTAEKTLEQKKASREKKQQVESPKEMLERLQKDKPKPANKKEQERLIGECKAAIAESDEQVTVFKAEYEQVTDYLTDIQKIDRIHGEDRDKLLEYCKRIKRLLQEKEQFQDREVTISVKQIRRFDRFQDELIDGIKKMYENEVYQKAIESDIRHLEAEKVFIQETRKEAEARQNFLKSITKGIAGIIISLIILFLILYFNVDQDMTYPYVAVLALTAVSAAAIFTEAGKNRQEMVLCDRKTEKAVGLLNRTKIKYINNVSALDYNREKYGVRDAKDFELLWGEYCKAKEFEKRYRENTERLHQNNTALEELLASYQVKDTRVWPVQTYAILDDREMVEIRHDLNTRRQKLREQIQYNTMIREAYTERMATVAAMRM